MLIILIYILISGGILFLILKLFRIKANYKKSLIFAGIFVIIAVFANHENIISFFYPSSYILLYALAVFTALFFIFYYLLHKYYQCSWKKSLAVYILFTIAVIGFLIITLEIIHPYVFGITLIAEGISMGPDFYPPVYVIVNKFDRDFGRGDIVTFRFFDEKYSEREQHSLKRIIGLPFEKVDIKDGKVFINDQVLDESSYYRGDTPGNVSFVLSEEQYFVLGDNRSHSYDSRNFGPIFKSDIHGKIFLKIPTLFNFLLK